MNTNCIANSRFAALVPLLRFHLHLPFLAGLIINDNYKTQQTEDEDSLTVGQGWYYIIVELPLVPRYIYKRRKQLYEGGGGGAGGREQRSTFSE
jgi:hypothetical protein